jgi:hypothetical protein
METRGASGLPCPNAFDDSAPNGLEGRIGSLVGTGTEVPKFSVGGCTRDR